MVNEDGNIEFIVPYNTGKALTGDERLLGVISRANKMGYVFGKDFEVGFEFYCGIRESSPSDFVIYKGSRAANDTVFKGYMRGLNKLRSEGLVEAVKRFNVWRKQPDFPGWKVFHYYEGHQMAHMEY